MDDEPNTHQPWTEAERLAALDRTGLLNTLPEQAFDDLVRLTADVIGAPMAGIHLIARDTLWSKAAIGFGMQDVPRKLAFCSHAIAEPGGLVVPDASKDARFANNPLVSGQPGIRFYAGVPLEAENLAIGALCVMDTEPRPDGLTDRQWFALRTLANQVNSQIALRQALAERAHESALQRQTLDSATDYAIISTDRQGRITGWNTGAVNILGWNEQEMLGQTAARFFTPEDRASGCVEAEMRGALADGRGNDERWHLRKDGGRFWANGVMMPLKDDAGYAVGFIKILRDRTDQHEAERRHGALVADLDTERQRLQAVLDSAPIGILVAEAPSGRIVEQNQRASDILGHGLIETNMLNADRQPPLRDGPLIRALMHGETSKGEELLYHRGDGRAAWVQLTAAPIRDSAGSITGGIVAVEDIERRKQVEADVQRANVTLEQRVAERTRERNGLWQVSQDLLGVADERGVWLSVNPAWTRVLGWSAEDIIGDTSDLLLHPDDRDRTRCQVGKAAAGGTTLSFENRFRTRTGDYRTLSWTVSRAEGLLYATARDVTEEKANAAALLLCEYIIQSDRSPVCAFDAEFRLTAFNKAHSDEFFRIYGYRVQIGDVFPSLLLPEQAPIIQGFMARALAGESFTEVEEFGDPDLARPYWEVCYNPIRDGSGRIIGAFHHAQDISARLRAEAELQATQDALRQSQKMEAVGQLTGGIAHDFNNLLMGISGSLELLQTRVARGQFHEADRYIEAAQAAAKRAAALTHRLLAFSRQQTLDPKPTDVHRLVAGMADLIRRTVGPAITIEVRTVAEPWLTLVDPPQLENGLLNLCLNARDAMAQGGKVTIEIANACLDARASSQRDLPPGHYVSLSVADTGTGMSPDVVAAAFDPFFTTKPLGQGTGLGLSMVYGFVRQSGGQVRIDSAPGRGTTVELYLPRYDGEVVGPESAQPKPAETPRAEKGETVLVVDDDATVRMLVAEALGDLGYIPAEASDGASGLEVLRSGQPIDLLVTDVGLPGGMNGRQLADVARELRPDLNVLFITGYAETTVFGHGHLAPGMQVLSKPFTIDTLALRIKELIENRVPAEVSSMALQ